MSTSFQTENAHDEKSNIVASLHHITAISGDAQRTHDFYARGLGMRLVKKTVNFDDPTTYHLYYGDAVGAPGGVMTFFPWSNAPRGRVGPGQATLTQFAVPDGALSFWEERLPRVGGAILARETMFSEARLVARDPDGLPFALVETEAPDDSTLWTTEEIPAAFAIHRFHGVTLAVSDVRGVSSVLTELFNYREHAEADAPGGGRYVRFSGGGPAGIVDVHEAPTLNAGAEGVGTVHHVAFAVPDRTAQDEVRKRLLAAGHNVTPPINRDYFWAIYFRTPAGILFEVATNEPGFDSDEPRDSLGTSLKLPDQHEASRERIENALPPLTT